MVGLGWLVALPGLKSQKTDQGSGELAVEGDFVAQQDVGRAESLGRAPQGGEHADVGWSYIRILERHVPVHGGFLRSPDSELAPASYGHGFDQADLGRGIGLIFVHEFHEQVEKAVLAFFVQDNGFRQKAMAGAVAGGVFLSVFGDGAFRFGSVGSGGFDLFWGHKITGRRLAVKRAGGTECLW